MKNLPSILLVLVTIIAIWLGVQLKKANSRARGFDEELVTATTELNSATNRVAKNTTALATATNAVAKDTTELATANAEVIKDTAELAKDTAELASKTAELAQDTATINEQKAKIAALEADAALKTLPLKIRHRNATFASGGVLVIENTGDQNLALNISVKRGSETPHLFDNFVINGNSEKTIAHGDGWAFVSGDEVEIKSEGYHVVHNTYP